MMVLYRSLLVGLLGFFVSACGSPETQPDVLAETPSAFMDDEGTAMGGSDQGTVSSGGASAYPEGPYGQDDPDVGSRLEDLKLIGLLRSQSGVTVDQSPFAATSLSELREKGARLALIHTATIWCPSCRAAADDLGLVGDELSEQGALIIELVLEGSAYGSVPSESELRTWALSAGLTVTTVAPDEPRVREVFPSREYAYVVDLATMEILWSEQALFTDPTITERGIAALRERL